MKISDKDAGYLAEIRENIKGIIRRAADFYDEAGVRILDIGPAEYEGAREFFKKAEVETLDINPDRKPGHVCDICETVPGGFDVIICTDVLEHVYEPVAAVKNMHRALNPGGVLVVSTPFNFRKHGPAPDLWRFTDDGLKYLLRDFEIVFFDGIASDRWLFPIHYAAIVKKV